MKEQKTQDEIRERETLLIPIIIILMLLVCTLFISGCSYKNNYKDRVCYQSCMNEPSEEEPSSITEVLEEYKLRRIDCDWKCYGGEE